ncbi:hypothetical protein QQX98_013267 [Neonectria punicea]|uniref:beta-glucosidase n=1 Tax=Neonectria punicea TaxID=979145 RepID=A0ABR1GGV6_9HYPO
MGIPGLVLSDWGGLNDTLQNLKASTDLKIPGLPVRRGKKLLVAILDGDVDEETHVDPCIRRVLGRSIAIVGAHARKPTTGSSGSTAVNPYYISSPHDPLIAALEKADPGLNIRCEQEIPASRIPPPLGNYLQALKTAGNGLRMDFYAGHELEGDVLGTSYWKDSNIYLMSDGDIPQYLLGKPCCYRLTGTITPNSSDTKRYYRIHVDNIVVPPPIKPYDNTLFDKVSGIRIGLLPSYDEDEILRDAIAAAEETDLVLVITGLDADEEKEGGERRSLSAVADKCKLIQGVAAKTSNVAVVVQSACVVSMPWVDGVGTAVQAYYQGQENGTALADVLVGCYNCSGKLPVTFPRRIEDHGSDEFFPGDAANDVVE